MAYFDIWTTSMTYRLKKLKYSKSEDHEQYGSRFISSLNFKTAPCHNLKRRAQIIAKIPLYPKKMVLLISLFRYDPELLGPGNNNIRNLKDMYNMGQAFLVRSFFPAIQIYHE